MIEYSRFYKKNGIPHIADPGQQIVWLKEDQLNEMIAGANLFISNDYELEMVMKTTGLDKAGLLALTPVLLITLAEEGSVMITKEGETKIPAVAADAVLDPTGAGDSFAGGLMGYLAASGECDDEALRKAVAFGTVMASFNVMSFGPQQLGDLTYTEIESRYREFRKIVVFEDIS